ncbi:MmgE/PrpD family protein [Nocardia otitidiscaviarum]|uniref:MmgE/PrpD family protein n=1 Tax=Nocardia otitidiscaviarum TaxID=1823 RepID=UPI001893B751|nr:MmgE/PrpD family protein [Nocardia otitidiscaviarum]MBF6180805.1 MmgE/PrpD family protein [Nocardia otitidiscaviarum]
MTSSSGLTRKIAAWIVEQQQEPLPTALDHHVRRLLLDHLAGVVASTPGEVSAAVARHAHRLYPGTAATAIGHGRLSVPGAAMINGTNGHGIESDEGYTPGSMHPTSVVFPAVFAVAQDRELPAERALVAAAIGMELACRLAAAGHPATRHRHFHNTPIAGVFGAAAAVSVLYELDVEHVANALGIAGSHASGLFEFLSSSAEVKRFHPGKAARDGIAAVDLVDSGLTGPTTVFEGTDGYFAAYAGVEGEDWHVETVLEGLGETWVLTRTYVKPYPCCRHLHGAIDAALAIRSDNALTPDEIESVAVGTFAIATRHAGRALATLLDAQLSLPFTVATALVRGAVGLTDFEPAARTDSTVLALMDKISVHLDPEADAAYPRSGRPAEVTITTTDGRVFAQRVQHPYGEPSNPMHDADLEAKARRLAEPVVGAAAATKLIAAAWDGDALAVLDVLDHAVRATAP